jgi:hypothetical protein
MKASKTFMLAAIFSIAVASVWVAAPQPADAQKASTNPSPKATTQTSSPATTKTCPGCSGNPNPKPGTIFRNPGSPKPK